MSYSIERRISHTLALALGLLLLALAFIADIAFDRLSHRFVLSRLQHDADGLIAALNANPAGALELDPDKIPLIYQQVRSGHYYQLDIAGQRLRSRSLWDERMDWTPPSPGKTDTTEIDLDEGHLLVWQQGALRLGQPVAIWIAEDIEPLEDEWQRWATGFYLLAVLAWLVILLLQRRLLRQSFAILTQARASVERLRRGEPPEWPHRLPAEIAPLLKEIDHLAGQHRRRLERSRTAAGNLAHSLKREVQHLNLIAEQSPPSVATPLRAIGGRIRQTIERELQRARIAGTPAPGKRFNPRRDCGDLVTLLGRIYPQVSIDTELVDGFLPLDRDDMLELTGNLLDNACKFGASRVRLLVVRHDGQVLLRVSDNGPGVAAELLEQLRERGTRVDESVEGSGLGLAICRMIVEDYGGSLQLEPAAEGGLAAQVRLPL